jgi:GntR family transcriptional regulator
MIKQIPAPNMAYRAADGLRRAIREGRYGPEGRLPAEPALSAELGVSRGTVREAVSILEQEGRLFRKQGSGTFVIRALSGLTNNLNSNFGVTDLIVAAGKVPGTVGVVVSEETADDLLAARLDIESGAPVVRIERTRTANGRPVAHTTDMLSTALLRSHGIEPLAIEPLLKANQSLYGALRSAGLVIQHGVAQLEPVAVDPALARRLETAPGTLLFQLNQIDYDASGQPVLHSVEHLVAGLLAVQVYRRGPG